MLLQFGWICLWLPFAATNSLLSVTTQADHLTDSISNEVSQRLNRWHRRESACQSSQCSAQERTVTTIRSSSSATDDVSKDFEQGLRRANRGGLLRLESGKTYVIGKILDLSWLNDVHVQLEGTIKFTDDVSYWQKNHVSHPFQNSISFWRWGGANVKIYGGGTIDGSGQKWWDGFANKSNDATIADQEAQKRDNGYLRPILFFVENMTRLDVSNINFRNPPAWNSFFVNSKDVTVDRCNFVAKSTNKAIRPRNSDGFDTYNVNGMRITNCKLEVGDDCVSPKPNTTNLLVENLHCKGTHGISMGSIGQYPGKMDYISNVLVRNVTLVDGTIGVRLKAWAGRNVGYGYMRNITYRNIRVENTDVPIVLDQCYFGVKSDECNRFPSKVNIEDIRFINVTGTSSGKKRGVMGSLRCSQGATCKNIELTDIHLRSRNGASDKPIIHCDGIKNITAGSCVGSRSRPNARAQSNHTMSSRAKKSAQEKAFVLERSSFAILLFITIAMFC